MLYKVPERQQEVTVAMMNKISVERSVYLPSRKKVVRCRLWYEVTPLHDGLVRCFLLGMDELESGPPLGSAPSESRRTSSARNTLP